MAEFINPILMWFLGIFIIVTSLILLLTFKKKWQQSANKKRRLENTLIGSYGTTLTEIAPNGPLGKVEVHGTPWNAEAFESIQKGARVMIVAQDNLTLVVQQI